MTMLPDPTVKITIKDRFWFLRNFEPGDFQEFAGKHPIISIQGSADAEDLVEVLGEHPNVLTLRFEDIPWESTTEDDARKVIEFADQKLAEGFFHFYIHCHMGISRSGATGLYLAHRYGYDNYEVDNPGIYILHKVGERI